VTRTGHTRTAYCVPGPSPSALGVQLRGECPGCDSGAVGRSRSAAQNCGEADVFGDGDFASSVPFLQ
jgi:hypothetical protein